MKTCPCTRERMAEGNLIGPACWKSLPAEVRQRWNAARVRDEKLPVAREIVAHARSRRPKKQPIITQAQLL